MNLSTHFCSLPLLPSFCYFQSLNFPKSGDRSPGRTFNHYKALSGVGDGGVSLKDDANCFGCSQFINLATVALRLYCLVPSPCAADNILFCIVFRWSWHELNGSRYRYFCWQWFQSAEWLASSCQGSPNWPEQVRDLSIARFHFLGSWAVLGWGGRWRVWAGDSPRLEGERPLGFSPALLLTHE